MKSIPALNILLATLLYSSLSWSQASETKVTYNKKEVNTATLELPYSPAVVEDAIKEYLKSRSAKTDKSKGFEVFRHSRLNAQDTDIQDVYCKVERKSRQKKDESVVYLFIGRNGEDVNTRLSTDRYKVEEARALLNEMIPHIDAFSLEVDIKEQESQVKKAEKKLQGLQTDRENMEKRIQELQDKVEENKRDYERQVSATQLLKDKLTELIGKRKS